MNAPAVPRFTELVAAANWRTVDFISDLHLQERERTTFEAWARYMAGTPADAVFILGDLFEVWVGDDAALQPGFAADCAAVLAEAARRRSVALMHGNRDFLLGGDLAARCGVALLDDPTVLAFGARRWLLTHGDLLCLDDTDYLRFRSEVRSPDWQRAFLARPLAQRLEIARGLRDTSEQRKRAGAAYADVDAGAARAWLQAAGAQTMIHGHTHKPATHDLGNGQSRIVLSDWDAAASPARLEALRLTVGGVERITLS